MKNVICIKTHTLTKQFENLYNELSKIYDTYVLFDKPIICDKFIFTDFKELTEYTITCSNPYWYYNHYSLLYFYKFINKNYDYYWFIEHDVKYSGKWINFFKQYENIKDDLLCTRLRKNWKEWTWYKDHNCFDNCDKYCIVGSIYRISNKGLKLIDTAHINNKQAFNEMMIPTTLKLNNLPINDFNFYGKAYDDISYDWCIREYKPELSKNTLWHKVITNE